MSSHDFSAKSRNLMSPQVMRGMLNGRCVDSNPYNSPWQRNTTDPHQHLPSGVLSAWKTHFFIGNHRTKALPFWWMNWSPQPQAIDFHTPVVGIWAETENINSLLFQREKTSFYYGKKVYISVRVNLNFHRCVQTSHHISTYTNRHREKQRKYI